MKLLIIICLITIGQNISVHATSIPTNYIRFNQVTQTQGLANSSTFYAQADKQGYVWIQSTEGVERYNFKEVKSYQDPKQHNYGLEEHIFTSIYTDSDDNLWLASRNKGLFSYDYRSERFTKITLPTPYSEHSELNRSRYFTEDSKGTLWLSTDFGFYSFTKQGNIQSIYSYENLKHKGLKNPYIRTIFSDSNDYLWLATKEGLHIFNPMAESFIELTDNHPLKALANEYIKQIIDTDDATWLLSLANGIYRYDKKTNLLKQYFSDLVEKHSPLFQNNILTAAAIDANKIFFGTYRGLYFFNANNNSLVKVHSSDSNLNIAESRIRHISKDDKGNFWLSTRNHGILEFSTLQWQFNHARFPGSDNNCQVNDTIISMAKTNKHLWFGYENNLIVKVNKAGNCEKISIKKAKSKVAINKITAVNNKIFVASTHGFYYIDEDENNAIQIATDQENSRFIADSFRNIEYDNHHSLWLASEYGLVEYNINSNQSTRYLFESSVPDYLKKSSHLITYLVLDNKNKLWFASTTGLFEFDIKSKSFTYSSVNEQLSNRKINFLHYAKDFLYIATRTDLNRLDIKTGELTKFEEFDDYKLKNINWVYYAKDGSLWLAQSKGLIRRKGEDITQFFGVYDGLQDRDFSRRTFVDAQGKLYVFGKNGYNSFFPEKIKVSNSLTQVHFDKLQVNGQLILPSMQSKTLPIHLNLLDRIELDPDSQLTSIDLRFDNFVHDPLRRFAFKIDGINNDWIEKPLHMPELSFSPSPGNYKMRVKAQQKNGSWGPEKNLDIVVHQYWWLTSWAKFCYGVFALVSLILFFRYRTFAIRQQAKLLQQKVAERTQKIESLLNQKNEEFATASHEFRTPLTLILGPLKAVIRDANLDLKAQQKLTTVKQNAYRLLRMVDQLLELEKFRVEKQSLTKCINLQVMLKNICQSFHELAQEKNVDFRLDKNDLVHIGSTSSALEKIFLNLFSNAIKYTESGGKVRVNSHHFDKHCVISIEDTGIGISPEMHDTIFGRFQRVLNEHSEEVTGAGIGLALVKEIIEAQGGSITLASKLGEGSCFTVTLPTLSEKDIANLELANWELGENYELEQGIISNSTTNETLITEHDHVDQNRTTILVIEDNPDMRHYIIDTLSEYYQCLSVENGEKGFQLAKELIPDLIISDVMMPVMDGFATAQALKAEEKTSHIPIILLTARGDKKSRITGWKSHADEYLTKPFDEEELLLRIENLLSIRKILSRRFGQAIYEYQSLNKIIEPDVGVKDNKFILNLENLVEKNYHSSAFDLKAMAEHFAMSNRQLQRKLKAVVNHTPKEYLRIYRLKKAKTFLESGQRISDVTYACGFASQSYFSKCFKAQYALTPSEFKQQC